MSWRGERSESAGWRTATARSTRKLMPVRRPPKHFLTNGKLGSCPNEG